MSIACLIPYAPEHQAAYEALNLQWIKEFGHSVDPIDEDHLQRPEQSLLSRGGVLFLAQAQDGAIVGSAAVTLRPDNQWELVKMAVAPGWRGKGLGRTLMAACIDWSRANGITYLMLETNSNHKTAIGMYERFGFKHLGPPKESDFVRCDVVMACQLAL